MWLTQRLRSGESLRLRSGEVLGGAEGLAVQGEEEYSSPEMIVPYGLSSVAAPGERAVMLGGYCAGVARTADGTLAEGEVRLYSSGGAEILLRQDGSVVINGQVFPAR